MSKFARLAAHRPIDGFVLSLFSVVLAATLLPCRGESARAFHAAGFLAIGSLFFLQGARLSRDAVLRGIMHWRLHAAINTTTYLLFPLLGLSLIVAFPHLLPPALFLGILFLCALPSTVQSSIALVSIAGGNVPAAVCSATASNIAGIVLAPLMFGAIANLHGGGGIDLRGLWQVILQLLVPFAAGHLLRPWIGTWAERNRGVLSMTDRGSILLVVYGAFSAAVVHGIWRQMPLQVLAALAVLMGLLLALTLAATIGASRAMSLSREDEAALVFCGSQKSLVSGVPIANALMSGSSVGLILLPLMLYYPMQLVICAWLARRYANYALRRAALLSDEAMLALAVGPRDEVALIEPLTAFARSEIRDNIGTPRP
jgi:solute carrier family 10 (sodium/bile acid cotransporter), member 7